MSEVIRALDVAELTRTRAGARHVLRVSAVRTIALDARMLAIAGDYLGCTVITYHATRFEKSAAANWLVVWRQDTALPVAERVEHSSWGP